MSLLVEFGGPLLLGFLKNYFEDEPVYTPPPSKEELIRRKYKDLLSKTKEGSDESLRNELLFTILEENEAQSKEIEKLKQELGVY